MIRLGRVPGDTDDALGRRSSSIGGGTAGSGEPEPSLTRGSGPDVPVDEIIGLYAEPEPEGERDDENRGAGDESRRDPTPAGTATTDCPHPSFPERYSEAYEAELDHFFRDVVGEGRQPAVDGYDGRQALVIAESAAMSFEQNAPVAIPAPLARLGEEVVLV